MPEFRYKAFISYSHDDESAARWLHRSLEAYRPPPGVRGPGSDLYTRSSRPLSPVFRDQDELVAAANLSDAIRQALAESEYLIVICSPAAAASHWVEQEILAFRQLRPPENVIAVIAHGEADSCFPRPLIYELTSDGEYSQTRLEPLAADLTGGRGQRRLALLKLAAAMLRVDLDALVQREGQRRMRALTLLSTGALLGMLLMGWLAYTAVVERREADAARIVAEQSQRMAEARRQDSEDLIEFMLGDLRSRLEPVGRLDVLDSVGAKVLTYYQGQDNTSLDANSMGRRARSLHLLGEIQNLRGDSAAALALFKQAADSTSELLQAEPDDPQRIFEHAQSLYWVGVVAMRRGQYAESSAALLGYRSYSQQLVKLQPDHAESLLELFYADQVLGGLAMETGAWSDAIQSFSNALDVISLLREVHTGADSYLNELASIHSWLRSAYVKTKAYQQARVQAAAEIDTWNALLAADAGDYVAIRQLIVALRGQSELALIAGDMESAAQDLETAADLAAQLIRREPGNTLNLEQVAHVHRQRATLHGLWGDSARASEFTRHCLEGAEDLVQRDPTSIWWEVELRVPCELQETRQLASSGKTDSALAQLREIAGRLQALRDKAPDEQQLVLLWGDTNLLIGNLVYTQGRSGEAKRYWLVARDALQGEQETLSSGHLVSLIEVLKRLNERERALQLTAYLRGKGYRHPGFDVN